MDSYEEDMESDRVYVLPMTRNHNELIDKESYRNEVYQITRVQEKNNCPLRFYLGLNLSTRLRKSNFDYFATKCYGQLSIQWTIVHTMSISWTIVHEMDNCYTIVHIVGNVHS